MSPSDLRISLFEGLSLLRGEGHRLLLVALLVPVLELLNAKIVAGQYVQQGPHDVDNPNNPVPMEIGVTRAAAVSQPFFGTPPKVASSAATPKADIPSDKRPHPEPSILDHLQVAMKGSDWLHSLSDYHQREIMQQVAFYQPSLRVQGLMPAAPKEAVESPVARTVPVAWPKRTSASSSKLSTPSKEIGPDFRLVGSDAVVPAKDIPRVNYSQTTMMEKASAFDLLECPVSYRSSHYTVVIDTGSSLNLMSYRQIHLFGMSQEVYPSKLYFKVANGSVSEARGEVRNVPLTFENLTFLITSAVLEDCCHDLLLGTSFLQEALGQIEFGKDGASLSLTDGKERVAVPVTCLRKKPSLKAKEVGGEGNSPSTPAQPISAPVVATVASLDITSSEKVTIPDAEMAELVGLHLKIDPPRGISLYIWTYYILDFRPGSEFDGCPGNEPPVYWQDQLAGK